MTKRQNTIKIVFVLVFLALFSEIIMGISEFDAPLFADRAYSQESSQSDAAEIEFWKSVKSSNDPDEILAYIEAYPDGKFVSLARIRLKRLQAEVGQAEEQTPQSQSVQKEEETVNEVLGLSSGYLAELEFSVTLGAWPGDPKRARMGTGLFDLDPEKSSGKFPGDVILLKIFDNTGAKAAGLASGDLVLEIDGQLISKGRDIIDAISKKSPGDVVKVRVNRIAKSEQELITVLEKFAATPDDGGYSNLVLAELYLSEALGVDNVYQAFPNLKRAAESGNTDAAYRYGSHLESGEKISKDTDAALRWYRVAAEAENPNALQRLGYLYSNGIGVPKNEREAVSFFKKSAELGNLTAMANLAYHNLHGLGVEANYQEAARWYEASIALNHAGSLLNLGQIYRYGWGGQTDHFRAAKLFQQSADLGDYDAMSELADCYYNGYGVAKDRKAALNWFKKSAEGGVAYAMYSVGFMYRYGQGTQKSLETAFDWFGKSANAGNSSAMYYLADMYEFGEGTPENLAEAVKWYRKSADNGNTSGMFGIGTLHYNGKGVSKNYSEALNWYSKAAKDNHVDSIYWAAIIHDQGLTGARDSEIAAELILRSFTGGYEQARTTLFQYPADLNRQTRREIQRILEQAGHYTGKIDGSLGPGSRRALESFLAEKNAIDETESAGSGTTSQEFAREPSVGLSVDEEFGDLEDLETLD